MLGRQPFRLLELLQSEPQQLSLPIQCCHQPDRMKGETRDRMFPLRSLQLCHQLEKTNHPPTSYPLTPPESFSHRPESG